MKYYKVKNYTVFRNKLLSLGEPKDIAKKISVHPSTVSKWTIKGKPNSDNIKALLEAYALSCDDLGVIEDDEEIEKNEFSVRLKQLLDEFNMKTMDLVNALQDGENNDNKSDVSKASIYRWLKGKSLPITKSLKKIANYFNVNTLYLLGETNIKNADYVEIHQMINIGEQILETLQTDDPNYVIEFMNEKFRLEDIGEKYFDLKNYIITTRFLKVLKEEVDRIVKWYDDDTAYFKFEDAVNEKEIMSQSTSYINLCTAKDIAHLNINKELDRIFDEYTNKILKEKGYTDRDIERPDIHHLNNIIQRNS